MPRRHDRLLIQSKKRDEEPEGVGKQNLVSTLVEVIEPSRRLESAPQNNFSALLIDPIVLYAHL